VRMHSIGRYLVDTFCCLYPLATCAPTATCRVPVQVQVLSLALSLDIGVLPTLWPRLYLAGGTLSGGYLAC
jgi:hypothetical protein